MVNKFVIDRANELIIHHPSIRDLESFITPNDKYYVLAALGVPRASADAWMIEVCGAVEQPFALTVRDLFKMPQTSFVMTMECAGDPLHLDMPLRRVSTAQWSGVLVSELIRMAHPLPGASHLWIDGADHGVYLPGREVSERVNCYRKDIPLERAVGSGALMALRMNGDPLPAIHGFPVRLVVPGYYGTNSVKWVTRLTVAHGRPAGLFCSTLYNEAIRIDGAIERRAVRSVLVNSVITEPIDGITVVVGRQAVAGWAWADAPVSHVMVRVGDEAQFEAPVCERRAYEWQRFEANINIVGCGEHIVSSQAFDQRGDAQPFGEHINQVHRIRLFGHPQ